MDGRNARPAQISETNRPDSPDGEDTDLQERGSAGRQTFSHAVSALGVGPTELGWREAGDGEARDGPVRSQSRAFALGEGEAAGRWATERWVGNACGKPQRQARVNSDCQPTNLVEFPGSSLRADR